VTYRMRPVLAVVVPCYNEEEVLPETIRRLQSEMRRLKDGKSISDESFLLLVDDGSRDSTWFIIESYHACDGAVRGLKLARNAGHQYALLAGLLAVKSSADCIISIDADLQDDITAFAQFVDHYRNGCEIVYGVRTAREEDTWFKRATALSYYRWMQRIGTPLVYNHADYRLLSARAVEQLACFKESNLFLRGLIPQLGLQSAVVTYERKARFAGESKYPLRKMISFAWNGVTSLSVAPIRLVLYAGFFMFLISLLAGIYALYSNWRGTTVPGWTSMMLAVWLLGGVQLISLGVVGEYVGKVYKETKRRPPFFIETYLTESGKSRSANPGWVPQEGKAEESMVTDAVH
jgi:glycosyltransferase involved in cell wall biosynthesis